MPDDRPKRRDTVQTPPTALPVYSHVARSLHWLTVVLIFIQVPLGWFMTGYAERTDFKFPSGQMYDAHKLLGLAILGVVVVRLLYRLVKGAPPDEPTLEPWQKHVSHLTHWAIYALLIGVPVIGWIAVSYYGPFAPFGISLPSLVAENKDQATFVFSLHGLTAWMLVVLIAVHIGAAIFHYFIRKDGVLHRMLPGLKR